MASSAIKLVATAFYCDHHNVQICHSFAFFILFQFSIVCLGLLLETNVVYTIYCYGAIASVTCMIKYVCDELCSLCELVK